MPTIDELYLAYRQAKITLFFDRRGVGLIDLARFESELEKNLDELSLVLSENGGWFDDLPVGDVWIVPKRLESSSRRESAIAQIGSGPIDSCSHDLEVQVRLSPSPQVAIVEVLFLWEFGPFLESILSSNAIGYRLDIKDNKLIRTRRWLFEYWPRRYEEFRTAPITAAENELTNNGSVLVLSADLASFYDTVDPSFLISSVFIDALAEEADQSHESVDHSAYRHAASSLVKYYSRFRTTAARRTGLEWKTGIPIGSITARIVANLSLATLDSAIERTEGTLCYRRYVDDMVIVARSSASSYEDLDTVMKERIPYLNRDEDTYQLDVHALHRSGSSFMVQKTKCKAYFVQGPRGHRFLSAIRRDYGRLVSENRAFLDNSVLADRFTEDATGSLLRVGVSDRALTVLRDVDRLKLEHFHLSTRLRSIERAAVLVDRASAREIAARTLDEVFEFLASDDDWVDNLDLSFRIFRLGLMTGTWDAAFKLIEYMDSIWGTAEHLKRRTSRLLHRGRVILRQNAWVWLRNYLHSRRVQDVCSLIPLGQPVAHYPDWVRDGIVDRTRRMRLRALKQRGILLSSADLRAFDREDDGEMNSRYQTPLTDFAIGRQDQELNDRLRLIQIYVNTCEELNDVPWAIPPSRLFLCTRPPSYFDVARRILYRTEAQGFSSDEFDSLLAIVNAIRGTQYSDPVGRVVDPHKVEIKSLSYLNEVSADPQIILGNLVVPEECIVHSATPMDGSNTGDPLLTVTRLQSVANVIRNADAIAGGDSLLVLPELALPRRWFRTVANHVALRGSYGLVVGLEYRHSLHNGTVFNQAYVVLPGPYHSVATWPWTKRFPAREEAEILAQRGVRFDPAPRIGMRPRTVVGSRYGDFSVLICSELIETRRVADLLKRVELVVVPAWNRDTASFEHLIQSTGLQLHAIVALANNGVYSDCRAWAPRSERWERDLCRLIERGRDATVSVRVPLSSLQRFHRSSAAGRNPEWQRLPPDW